MSNPTSKIIARDKTTFLLITLIFVWGLNWPITKLSLAYIEPFWLSTIRMLIAAIALFIYLIITKQFTIPKKADMPVIFSMSILYMAIFTVFTSIGLEHVDPGRSAILSYTSPLWVTPAAVLFFKEKLTAGKLIGVLLGLAGVIVLFNPFTFDWHNSGLIYGNSLLLLAAIAVAASILHMRHSKPKSSALQLCPWQLLLASAILYVFAHFLEPNYHFHWSFAFINELLYISLLATGFGYWAVMEIAQKIPAMKTSIFLLAVPMVSLISSTLIFKTPISLTTVIAMILIFAGLISVARARE